MTPGPIPAPAGDGQDQSSPGPGGGFPAAAPAEEGNGAELLRIALGVVSSIRVIANKVPSATPEVRQINDLIAKVIGKIKGGGPAAQPQAPPV